MGFYHRCFKPGQLCPKCRCRPCCCCRGPVVSSFTAVKLDGATSTPLEGAVFTIFQNGLPVATSVSGETGTLAFSGLEPGEYEIREIHAPSGYAPDSEAHYIKVDSKGNVTIDRLPADGYVFFDAPLNSFSFAKTDAATGRPVTGAAFTLSNGQTAVSGENGNVDFGPLAPGIYAMSESQAPAGYLPTTGTYRVEVSDSGGVTVNGIPAQSFAVENEPLPSFAFRKYDEKGNPLQGAAFSLSNGRTAVSDSGGLVDFGLLEPGAYALTEIRSPVGYDENTIIYTVEVSDDGSVTVDGIPVYAFSVANSKTEPSPRPVIISVTEGNAVITGQGVPGAAVTVTLPDGAQLNTVVGNDGFWSAALPNGEYLDSGETIYARQTVPGYGPSEEASFIVKSRA